MKNLQTIERLKKSILVFSVLSVLIVGVIVAVVAVYPLFNQLKKDAARNLLDAAKIRKMAIEQFLDKLEQTTWQITSRTKAREKLEQYNREEVSLQQLVDFSKPILGDALHLSKEAVGCLRFDKAGKPVVQAGRPIPESFWVLPREEETRVRMHGPVSMSDTLYVVVGAPIFDRKKVRVGTDLVMFQLDELRIIVQDHTGLGISGETILGMVADKTRVQLFFPPGKKAEKHIDYVNIDSPIGLAMEQASHLSRNKCGLLTSSFDRPQVFAFSSIPEINNWALVIRMNAKELYAPINQQVIIILLTIFALLLLGTLGTILLLRPLAGKIIIHTEELGSINQQLVQEAEERKRAEEKMLRSDQRFRLHSEQSPLGFLEWDDNFHSIEWNAACEQIFGYTREEAIGRHAKDLILPIEVHDLVDGIYHSLMNHTGGQHSINENVTKDGRIIICEWFNTTLINKDGKAIGVASVCRDITEQKRMEVELAEYRNHLEEQVKERTAELEAANKELEAFAYSVSHDLRAPLRHIDGFIELLQKKAGINLDEQSRHYMGNISDAAQKMGRLIDDLLSFSRMGRQAMSLQQVDLENLVRDIMRELESDAARRNIEWRIGDLPAVKGDAAMLRIVLVNLISNALKFTRPVQQAEIEIGSMPDTKAETIIFVLDNGVGFDMTYADKLFGVFQRLHPLDEFEGSGIGLANVRRIIARHGGRTWATGEQNQGATFYFSLPQTKQG